MKMKKGKGGLLAEYLRCHGGDLKDEAKKQRSIAKKKKVTSRESES